MARALSVLCCLLVGLQFLIGVPVMVCLGFFGLYGGLGPISIEVHPGAHPSTPVLIHGTTVPPPHNVLALAPPPNIIPHVAAVPANNPILDARSEHGSPLAGTILSDSNPPNVEQELFVAAFEKVAAEAAQSSPALPETTPATSPDPVRSCDMPQNNSPAVCTSNTDADQSAIRHLYEMADVDERAGNYERADQWRAQAREIRQSHNPPVQKDASASDSSADLPPLNSP